MRKWSDICYFHILSSLKHDLLSYINISVPNVTCQSGELCWPARSQRVRNFAASRKLLLVQQTVNKRERQEAAFYAERNADDDKTYKAKKKNKSSLELLFEVVLPFRRKNALLNQQHLGEEKSCIIFPNTNSNSLAKKKNKMEKLYLHVKWECV